ncbi:MAG: hypothetical protein LBV74_09845 [Tannerella sp.]|nr:hypothetical protein [Tannerella sp.]
MAQGKTNNEPETNGYYPFQRCSKCGIKLHVSARSCWKCGAKGDENTYDAHNPTDSIYSLRVNDLDICLDCKPTQNNNTCKTCHAFGFGKGDCEMCNRFESIRFQCCQKAQWENQIDAIPFEQSNGKENHDNSRLREAV